MIGFHYQGNADGWPTAVARLPKYSPVKFVDGVQRAVESKSVNPNVHVNIRHHVGEQNPQGDYHEHARRFFASFVDESFGPIAWAVDSVSEYNEYFSDSQSDAERQRWINWIQACVDVWRDEYRTQSDYAHIDLVLAETAVGNNIPLEVARIAHNNPFCILGYHPYVPVYKGVIRPDHWEWYSGRWATKMDNVYRYHGYHVRWFFGEFGAVGHTGPGWPNSLAPNDGWRHKDVFNGDINGYLDLMTEWVSLCEDTVAWQEGRVIGATIFTSGGGNTWKYFEVKQPEMNAVADHITELMTTVPIPTPDPTPDPEPPVKFIPPRVDYKKYSIVVPQDVSIEDYKRAAVLAYADRRSLMFSYDDAGMGPIDRTVVLMNIDEDEHQEYRDWYNLHYPGARVEFSYMEFSYIIGGNGGEPVLPINKIVDVSTWQGNIDWWQMVKNGVTHAYIKCSERVTGDPRYQTNVDEANRVGVTFGVYHFYRNGHDAADQAAFFLENAQLLGSLPPVLDIEDSTSDPDPEGWRIWLEIVEDQTGRRPAIYTAPWYWNRQRLGGPIDWASTYKLWVADIIHTDAPTIPTDWQSWWLWQYGQEDGEQYGVESSKIDLNKFNPNALL